MDVINYIAHAPYFWSLMGWTTATAVFIGAMLYNGDFERLKRGVITIVSYVTLLYLVTWARVTDSITTYGILSTRAMAYAGLYTIGFVTAAYLLGLVLGYITVKHNRKKEANH